MDSQKTLNHYKKIFLGLVIISTFVLVGVLAFFEFTRGEAVLTVESSMSPLKISVVEGGDGKRLHPVGENGREYIVRGAVGVKRVTIKGPYIENTGVDVVIEYSGTKASSTKIQEKSVRDIVNSTAKISQNQVIAYEKTYGLDDSWILVSLTEAREIVYQEYQVLHYVPETDEWRIIESGGKIDYANLIFLDAPGDLLEFIERYAGD